VFGFSKKDEARKKHALVASAFEQKMTSILPFLFWFCLQKLFLICASLVRLLIKLIKKSHDKSPTEEGLR